jgi:hypothetical protein
MNTDYKYNCRKVLYGNNTNIYKKNNSSIEYFKYKNKKYNVKDYKRIKGGGSGEEIKNVYDKNEIDKLIIDNYPLLYDVFKNDEFVDEEDVLSKHHTFISDKLNNINIEYSNFIDSKGGYFLIVKEINTIRKNLIGNEIVMNDCFMCMNKKATHIFKDCCHKCMCKECATIAKKCPFCDEKISIENKVPIEIFDSSTILIGYDEDKNTNYEYNYVPIKTDFENVNEEILPIIQNVRDISVSEKRVSLRKRSINEKKEILKKIPSSIIEFKKLLEDNYPKIYEMFINKKEVNVKNEEEYKYFINKNKKINRDKYLKYSNVLLGMRGRVLKLAIADDDCIICNSKKATYTFGCGHKCMCRKCIEGILYDGNGELLPKYKCPICNLSGEMDNDIAYDIIDVSSNDKKENEKMLKIIMGV